MSNRPPENSPSPDLERLQGWMQAVITHPGGVHVGVASKPASQHLKVDEPDLETVVTPSATLTGAERLAIYGRSYRARLLDCLRSMFPALLHALGHELFDRFALDYLGHHPPSDYSLHRLAKGFPEHLAQTRPDAHLPAAERDLWPNFILDLATLEETFREVYDGPGTEDQTLPTEAEMLSIDPALLLASRPVPACCLRLLTSHFPVYDYLLAVRREESPEIPAPSTTFLAVVRLHYGVRMDRLLEPQYEVLRALDGERTLAQALQLAEQRGLRESIDAATTRSWFRAWVGGGYFAKFDLEPG